DIAVLFDDLDKSILPLLFRLLPKELAAETFVEMDSDAQEMLIRGFSDSELKEVIDELYLDDAVDLIEEMPANVVRRILGSADPDTRKMINELLKYPEDSAGSLMTVEYVSLRPTVTVEQAIRQIRRTGIDKETVYTCYVIGDDRRLLGFVSVRTLLVSEEETPIEEVMETNVIYVHTSEDKEEVANLIRRYDFIALPVVDEEQRLVGIVTVDDALDVMQEEFTEDLERIAAITPTDKPYLRMGVLELYKSRILWLLLLMISATFTGTIITSFESALAAQVALASFIPMLMNTGGNCGSQTSVTVIRGLSLGEIDFADLPRVLWKEARVSLLCGVTLAAASFLKLLLFDKVGMAIAGVICVTLFATVVCAKLVGCVLPILSKKLGLDPAVMSNPFITTIVDAVSLIIYFQVATKALGL
ncbi:MAG: magnesium transporter, partial [Clostridia bacterium]|nr:magnesium transporter [Clostridia bacterium]